MGLSVLDWLVLLGTLFFIVLYGVLKTQNSNNLSNYLLAGNKMKWWAICISIMGTQASAITFLSLPGQAFNDGMRFVQFYFGLPLAMIVIAVTAVPIYAKLKVYTAYEYLETRFDVNTRALAAVFFLLQRGLSTGITIYAPAIVLSTILGWSVNITILIIGAMVILYTVSGGAKAVSITQNIQMMIIIFGMFLAGTLLVNLLPKEVGLIDSIHIAGHLGKMNAIDFQFDWHDRYNFWSGITGGFFLSLSYFGTDQSQVGRYLGGESERASKLGLVFNGLLKIPMQFLILLLGVLMYVFYLFYTPPIFFNQVEVNKVKNSQFKNQYINLENQALAYAQQNTREVQKLQRAIELNNRQQILISKDELLGIKFKTDSLRAQAKQLIVKANPLADNKDGDYIFIYFILTQLPQGVIGLLLAAIFCAAMSSTAAGLNSLAGTTGIDIYKRLINNFSDEKMYVRASKWFTFMWGILAIAFAFLASRMENLIQTVNILGSLFYGTILGVFLVGFYIKSIGSKAVFWAAIFTEIVILLLYFFSDIAFLWYNVIACMMVCAISFLFQKNIFQKN
jgi:SSS family transporter